MERFIDGPSYVNQNENIDNKVLGIIYILTALAGVSWGISSIRLIKKI